MNELTALSSPQLSPSLDALQLSTKAGGKPGSEEVSKQFEGVFISLLVKEMRNTTEEGGFFGSESTDSFGSMFDMYMGEHLAEAQPLGISSLWVQQYEMNSNSNETAGKNDSIPA